MLTIVILRKTTCVSNENFVVIHREVPILEIMISLKVGYVTCLELYFLINFFCWIYKLIHLYYSLWVGSISNKTGSLTESLIIQRINGYRQSTLNRKAKVGQGIGKNQ